MKKRIVSLILALVMVFAAVSVLAACEESTTECTAHADSDKNGLCDSCGVVYYEQHDCNDYNVGGKCRYCKKTVQTAGGNEGNTPCEHEDEDNNNKCDICGVVLDTSEECAHVDADGDGWCDICDEEWEEPEEIIDYPWTGTQTLIFQFTENSNNKELSSGCHRYLAGDDDSFNETIDKNIDRRNSQATYYTNIEIKYAYFDDTETYGWGSCIDEIESVVKSGSTGGKTPDVYCNFVYDMVGASVKGCFANLRGTSRGAGALKGLNYFEFLDKDYNEAVDNRGYMNEYMHSVTLSKHKMYILASDYFTDMIRAFFIIPVSVQLMNKYVDKVAGDLNGDGEYNIDDFYAQVDAMQWDYELLKDYAELAHIDDGNGETTEEWIGDKQIGFAFANGGVAASGLLYTTSVVIINRDFDTNTNDNTYYYPASNDDLYKFCDATTDLMRSPGICRVKSNDKTYPYEQWGSSTLLAIRTRFAEGVVLFGDIMMVGALEYQEYQSMRDKGGFGVVPVPLYDGNRGDKYLTQIHNVGRPGAIAANTTKFVECTAYLNYQSTHSTDILNDYYNYKLMYDVAGGADGTVAMLKYIRLNVRTSFDKVFEDAIGVFHGDEGYDSKILPIISGAGFEIDLRQQYGTLYEKKSEQLKLLIAYYENAPD